MTPQECINLFNSEGSGYLELWKLRQSFADQSDFEGAEYFFSEMLKLHSLDIYESVKDDYSGSFEARLTEQLRLAFQMAAKDETVKAIDCNYYFDGNEGNCAADVFTCHEYYEDSQDWQFSWSDEDHIQGGPEVYPYLKWPTVLGLERRTIDEWVTEVYSEGMLLVSFLRALSKFSVIDKPIAFGETDSNVIIVRPNENA